MTPDAAQAQVIAHTTVQAPMLVPSVRLHLVGPDSPLWNANELEAAEQGLPMPYWAFAWPGGQALAWYLERNPQLVAGRTVLSFGAGAGLEAIVALRLGAASVICSEIDPLACAALRLNASLNGVSLQVHEGDLLGADQGWDVVLCGDVTYEPELTQKLLPWLGQLARRGAQVLLGDAGRVPLEGARVETIASVDAPHDGDPRGLALWTTRVLSVV